VPAVDESDGFADAVRSLTSSGRYEAVFVSSDAEVIALDWPGAKLLDKSEVARRARLAGFSDTGDLTTPDGASLMAAAPRLPYPLVVKPVQKVPYRHASSGRLVHPGNVLADGPRDLAAYPAPLLVQPWLTGETRGVSGVVWGGRLRAVVHQTYLRTWPRAVGITTFSHTTAPDLALEEKVVALLDGYDGPFNIDYIGEHVLDINPRVYGTVAMTSSAGLNLMDVAVRLLEGEDLGRHEPLRCRDTVGFRWVEGDLRRLVTPRAPGPRRDRAWPGRRRVARKTLFADLDVSDPGPTVARALYLGRRLLRR
jgi:hypothetical protein